MYTRQQYLANECTHDEYYRQFVDDFILHIVEQVFTLPVLRTAYAEDPVFNTIPLKRWDTLTSTIFYYSKCQDKLKQSGDTFSLGTGVCILKAAAKILVEQHSQRT
jgi:hypothetical protein